MADYVEQFRLMPTAQPGPNPRLLRAFDLNHSMNDSESDDNFNSTDTSSCDTASSSVSDSESCISGKKTPRSSPAASSGQSPCFGDGLIRLSEGDKAFDLIERQFMAGLGRLGGTIAVNAIHKNVYSAVMAQARARAFQIYMRATEKKLAGNANVKYAWYAASKEDIPKILSYGFGYSGSIAGGGLHGSGIYLSPDNHPLESLKLAPVDGDGLRHLFLCRIILGKPELVRPGSNQYHPSSDEFDSGVDSLDCPKKYIVWSTHMNTHVLPEYVLSVRAPCNSRGKSTVSSAGSSLLISALIADSLHQLGDGWLAGFGNTESLIRKPTSPWMPFPMLISELSKILPAPIIGSISKQHRDYKDGKISRQELIGKVRQFTGDKLLISVIKSFRTKLGNSGQQATSTGRTPRRFACSEDM
ncbi:hypothetical protein SAY86_003694 [Trapa natans]|uniref:Inactive poly [ADP-ribose] polymerase SRO5 n=1 Tax=Trapa natans TaxID=22666 RepID=A0AAN7MEM6_TRANT|nr:hypothetical protein SAY86_003694 [Trapa natans]